MQHEQVDHLGFGLDIAGDHGARGVALGPAHRVLAAALARPPPIWAIEVRHDLPQPLHLRLVKEPEGIALLVGHLPAVEVVEHHLVREEAGRVAQDAGGEQLAAGEEAAQQRPHKGAELDV